MIPIIHWDFGGKSNADADTIVKDLTGNGYDLELKNFDFDNESGYNGYPIDFRKWDVVTGTGTGYDDTFPIVQKENKVIFNGTIVDNKNFCAIKTENIESSASTFAIKVSGLKENQTLRWYNYKYDTSEKGEVQILYKGINIIDGSGTKQKCLGYYSTYDGNVGKTLNNVTVEIFPLYPDQLVFNNNKAHTVKPVKINATRGFTVIFRRQFIREDMRTVVLGQQGNTGSGDNFYIRDYKKGANSWWSVYNFGTFNTIYDQYPSGNLMWSTLSKFFNGQIVSINRPVLESPDDNPLILGAYNHNNAGEGNFAVREVYIFDRDLTQSQIEKFISDNMIPLPEVYYDIEKQGTLNEHTIKDKLIDFSGNQHHGTLHNFTFDETNGWGYYPLDTVPCDKRATGNTVVINGNSTGVVAYNQRLNINAENFTQDTVIPEFRVKVIGLSAIKETQPNAIISFVNVFINDGGTNTSNIYSIAGTTNNEIREDGIYTVPSHTVQFSNKQDITSLVRLCDLCWSNVINDGSVNITVEFLPTDEDCLRFDADNDTNVTLDNITEGFKTVFAQIMPFDIPNNGAGVYDQRVINGPNTFAIYGDGNSIAWNARNSGVTYINGELNTTTKVSELDKIRHNITIVNEDVTADNSANPKIGILFTGYAGNFKLYKFLGFKEALSEKQIQRVIERYGLQIN